MPRPVQVACYDWSIEPGDGELRLTPSWRTFRKCLMATAIAAVFIGMLVYYFGFPPGGGAVGATQDEWAEREERQHEDLRELEASVDAVAEAMGDEDFIAEVEQRRAESQARLEADRERYERRRSILRTAGTTVYWIVLGVLVLLAVLPPLAVFWEKTILRTDGGGGLTVIRRGQLARSQRYPPHAFSRIVIEPKHIVTYSRHAGEIDRGWRWSVQLLPADPHLHRPLILLPEWEPGLPARPERLTSRVRQLVRFIANATNIDEAMVVKDGKPIGRIHTQVEG